MWNNRLFYCVLLIILTFISCRTIEELDQSLLEWTQKNHKYDSLELASIGIDTSLVYKLHSSWKGPSDFISPIKIDFELREELKDYRGHDLKKDEFVKFQSYGKIKFYSIDKNITLNNKLFNDTKGSNAVYYVREGVIYIKRYLGIGHGPKLIRGMMKIKGDTLHEIEMVSLPRFHFQYLKVEFEDTD